MAENNDALTQEEVDALFENDKQTENGQYQGVRSYDFLSQERTVRARLPALERIYKRFAKKLDTSMYDLTSREVDVTMGEITTLKYSDYINSLPTPTCFHLARMNPLRGTALFMLDAAFVFILVENFFGGDGRYNSGTESREFTATEIRVVQILLNMVFKDIQDAWAPIIPVNVEVIKHEMNPQLVNIVSSNDIIYIAPFKVAFGGGVGELQIVMPYAMLGTIREQLDVGAQRSDEQIDERWVKALREEVFFSDVEISANLVEKEISLREVIALKNNDIISVELPELITVLVEGIASFRARYGVSNDKCALKIVEKIKR